MTVGDRDQLRHNLSRTREMLDAANDVPLETFKILDSLFHTVYAIYLEAAGIIRPSQSVGGETPGPQFMSMQEMYDKMKAEGLIKDEADPKKVEKKVETISTGQYL